jgi:hypothetical protein
MVIFLTHFATTRQEILPLSKNDFRFGSMLQQEFWLKTPETSKNAQLRNFP